MGHWRDGGIGNMAGSDDRPIEEWTLLEKLASIATTKTGEPIPKPMDRGPNDWGTALSALCQEAFDEIVRLREATPQWQPIDTAPVEPAHTVPIYYRFHCLLQNARGEVSEGHGYYVKLRRNDPIAVLRWATALGQCSPKYWMPLPAPKVAS